MEKRRRGSDSNSNRITKMVNWNFVSGGGFEFEFEFEFVWGSCRVCNGIRNSLALLGSGLRYFSLCPEAKGVFF